MEIGPLSLVTKEMQINRSNILGTLAKLLKKKKIKVMPSTGQDSGIGTLPWLTYEVYRCLLLISKGKRRLLSNSFKMSMIFFFGHAVCGILVPWLGIKVQSLNSCTPRQIPFFCLNFLPWFLTSDKFTDVKLLKKIIKGMNKNLTTREIFPVLLLYSPQRGNIINVRQ